MPTTTLKLSEELKARIAAAAANADGRVVEAGLRELVISRGRSGHVALYRYDVAADLVLVLALRHQREGGYSA